MLKKTWKPFSLSWATSKHPDEGATTPFKASHVKTYNLQPKMKLNLIDQLGEWNPQLFRELKGRLKHRNVLITVVGSSLSQLILLFFCYRKQYLGYYVASDWYIEWSMLYGVLNWLLPFSLLVGGVHTIISDLVKEECRGTLNFIRLSPQSSQSILSGKVLGVPALLYLAVALAIPLHLGSALAVGLPLNWVVSIYTLWGAGCCLFYSATLLSALLNGSQRGVQYAAWTGSFLACLLGWPYISVINSSFDLYQLSHGRWDWQWFFLPIGTQPLLAFGLTLSTMGTATYWFWQAVNRRFHNPNAPLLSKPQSYWLVASFQLWLLGFVLPELNSAPTGSHLVFGLCFSLILNPIYFLFLIAALSPQYQALQDWARYRRDRVSTNKSFWNSSLMQDLIWSDKSPILVAIVINLLITATIWVPWILLWPQSVWQLGFKTPQALLALLMTANVLLIFTAIVELVTLSKIQQGRFYVSGTLTAIFLMPLSFSMVSLISHQHPSPLTVFLGLLGPWCALSFLSWQLTHQLRRVGESASRELFAAPPLLSSKG